MPRWGMVIDLAKCVGCYACTVACKAENATPKDIWYSPVYEKEIGQYPTTKRMFIPTLCNHCDDPPCMKACPTGAIYKRNDGIVVVEQEVCCGTRACVAACPYGAMHFNAEAKGEFGDELTPFDLYVHGKYQVGTVQKCTFCAHRIDKGIFRPACVESCPTECRIFGDLDDPHSKVSQLNRKRNGVQPRAEAGTGPSVWYLL